MNDINVDHKNMMIVLYKSRIKMLLMGFFLSIILILIPYLGVTSSVSFSKRSVLWTILTTFVIQFIVYLICFFQLNFKYKNNWNLIAFIFILTVISILMIGSVWIMWNLNHNMILH